MVPMSQIDRELLLQLKATFDAMIHVTHLLHTLAVDHQIDIDKFDPHYTDLVFRDYLWLALSDVGLLSSEKLRSQQLPRTGDSARLPDAADRTSESHPG